MDAKKDNIFNHHNHVIELTQTVKDVKKHLEAAENENKRFEQWTTNLEQELQGQDNSIDTQLMIINNQIILIKDEIKYTIKYLQDFIKLLKLKAKKKELSMLSENLDEWSPDKFITKKTFMDMLKQS